MTEILVNGHMNVEVPDFPPMSNQVTVSLPKSTRVYNASITGGPDELECFFSSPLEKWPTEIFREFFDYGTGMVRTRQVILAQFVTCFRYPTADSIAVWIRQQEGTNQQAPNSKDIYIENVESSGMDPNKVDEMYEMDTALQKSDLILIEKGQGAKSEDIKIDREAVIIGARLMGSLEQNHRYCELTGNFRTYFFTEIQPFDMVVSRLTALICYWKQDDGRGVLG